MGLSKEEATDLTKELVRFLALKMMIKDYRSQSSKVQVLSCSPQIDEAWRILMNLPIEYKKICYSLMKSIVKSDVIEYKPMDDVSDRRTLAIQLYELMFGITAPEKYWGGMTIYVKVLTGQTLRVHGLSNEDSVGILREKLATKGLSSECKILFNGRRLKILSDTLKDCGIEEQSTLHAMLF